MELMEILFILAILLFIFGPKKLPELSRELGKVIFEFKKASSGIIEEVESPSVPKSTLNSNGAIKGIAKKLNIKTEGRNIKKIIEEIVAQIEKNSLEK